MNNYGPTLKEELTPKQYELCGLLALGWALKEIAIFLRRSELGVRSAFAVIYEKTDTSDKLELACRFAWERMDRGL